MFESEFEFTEINEKIMNGGVIAYPTETVWGLGASIYKPESIKAIFDIKGRSFNQPLSVLVRDVEVAKTLVMLNQQEKLLLKSFWPGPISFIFPALDKEIASHLGSTDGTICLRCSNHDWIKEFVLSVEDPIVSTSANVSGQPPATSRKDLDWLPDEVYVVDYVEPTVNKRSLPSTILKPQGQKMKVIRNGAWPIDKLKPLLEKLSYELILD